MKRYGSSHPSHETYRRSRHVEHVLPTSSLNCHPKGLGDKTIGLWEHADIYFKAVVPLWQKLLQMAVRSACPSPKDVDYTGLFTSSPWLSNYLTVNTSHQMSDIIALIHGRSAEVPKGSTLALSRITRTIFTALATRMSDFTSLMKVS